MKYDIKLGHNNIYTKEFYYEDPKTGYRIAVTKGPDASLEDSDLKAALLERIEDYHSHKR